MGTQLGALEITIHLEATLGGESWNGASVVIACFTNYAVIVAINMEIISRECVV